MIRLIALVIIGIALVSCASGSYEANVGKVVDMIPEWAGGLPKGVPPRPGTPEYEAVCGFAAAEAQAIFCRRRHSRSFGRPIFRPGVHSADHLPINAQIDGRPVAYRATLRLLNRWGVAAP